MIKFIFDMQMNTEVFYKLILSFWLCVTRHSKVSKINLDIFVISPEKGDEVDFLSDDKHESFL